MKLFRNINRRLCHRFFSTSIRDINIGPVDSINLNIRSLSASPTLAIFEKTRQLKKEGKKVIQFGFGQSPFPVPNVMVKEMIQFAHEKDYLNVQGLPELRETIANYYSEKIKREYTMDDVIIGPGTKPLMFLLQMVYYANLYLPRGSWVSYAPQAIINNKSVHWIDTNEDDDYRLTPSNYMNAIKNDLLGPKLLILNYPCNPTGATYNSEQIKELANVFKETRTLVLSDEIYSEVNLSNENHTSLAEHYYEGTIISSGLSKFAGAGGWRLGFFIFPPNLRSLVKQMANLVSESYSCVHAPTQYAAILAYQNHIEIEKFKKAQIDILEYISKFVYNELQSVGLTMPLPKGGFYVFPNFGKVAGIRKRFKNSEEMTTTILEEAKVGLLPGTCFGRYEDELTARLAFVDFDGKEAMTAYQNGEKIDEKFLQKYCMNVVDGINQLKEWVKKH